MAGTGWEAWPIIFHTQDSTMSTAFAVPTPGVGRPPKGPTATAARIKRSGVEHIHQSTAKDVGSLHFRQKVELANNISICNASINGVRRMSMRRLLAADTFCVPIFQRRYCWNESQWTTLLDDVARARGTSGDGGHSLGRLTCTRTSPGMRHGPIGVKGRSCILDGQQRLTTTTILLATIRDLLEEMDNSHGGVDIINKLLFTDEPELNEWRKEQQSRAMSNQGEELSFARMVPTFCDRAAYYEAILPNSTHGDTGRISSDSSTQHLPRPMQAKVFFQQSLRSSFNSTGQLNQLLNSILDGLTMLYFPVEVNTGASDGTEDLMVIYERLALRDATFCKPTRSSEYESMDGADLIRNLLLGSFNTEHKAETFYRQYWLPLERLCDDGKGSVGVAETIRAFLAAEKENRDRNVDVDDIAGNEPELTTALTDGIIGGQIYAEFQVWFANRLSSTSSENEGSIEAKICRVGYDMLAFAQSKKEKTAALCATVPALENRPTSR